MRAKTQQKSVINVEKQRGSGVIELAADCQRVPRAEVINLTAERF